MFDKQTNKFQLSGKQGVWKFNFVSKDWKSLFLGDETLLEYHPPSMRNGRVVVFPPQEVIEVVQWSTCLVGQFFDKHLSFFLVKRFV